MWTIDTSVYVRDVDPSDKQHADCQELLAVLEQRGMSIIVPRLLLAELAGVIRRLTRDPIRARLAIDVLQSLPHVQLISLGDDLIDNAANVAADYALRGADACFIAVAQQYGCNLVSLDREQREHAASILTVYTPAEALAALQ